MAQENRCPQCGAQLLTDAPEGLCPKCLMKAAMGKQEAEATLENPPIIEGPGTAIGRYELLELISEGGMGLVYLAEQKEPVKRRVALKIIKPGMDSKQVIARFEAERQALALLDHPNIAHIFDAGTTETGRPYFVMEYVKGMSITRYCDERKLNIEQRLRLFEQVCEGVHHAHQKGIIHRDIKPSNILVSVHGDRAVPKIIDFGIAKAVTQPLTDKTFVTFQGQLLGTPEYMSPEQVDLATQDIDTRSDIYSLGVVLYELLAGVLPFERESFKRAGFAEIQQMIREQEPDSPSIRLTHLGEKAKTIAASRGTQVIALARRLHRELEWIPLKAMRKDRCRRYKSASELADDIRNYLNGNPLIAGPETAVYRVRKFVYKHAGSVATVVLIAAVIILGLVVSTAMYFRSERALVREAAARQKEAVARNEAEQAKNAEQEQRKVAEQKAEDLRRTMYVNSIQLADAKYKEDNIGRVRELLAACPNDLRGWEWYRLNYISDLSFLTIHNKQGEVLSIDLSPDGKRFVSGDGEGNIKLWDLETGVQLSIFQGDSYIVNSVALSPDGLHIASCGYEDGVIKIWDAVKGEKLMTLYSHYNSIDSVKFYSLKFGPDGKSIAAVGYGSGHTLIEVWNLTSGEEVMTLHHEEGCVPCFIAFNPDGKHIISGGWDTIKVWDVNSGAKLMTLRLREHKSFVYSVAFSPDGKRIVSGDFYGTISIWDVETGKELLTFRGHSNAVRSISYAHDERFLLSGSDDNTIKVWNAATGKELMTLRGHCGPVNSALFSLDDKMIISGSNDKTIKLWDVLTCKERMAMRIDAPNVPSISYSPDGKHIASVGPGNKLTIWDSATGEELMSIYDHKGEFWRQVAYSIDGKRIISSSFDQTIKVWDTETGKQLTLLRGHDKFFITAIACSPDGRHIASADGGGTIKIWDSIMGVEVLNLPGHEGCTGSLTYSPDGTRIIAGGYRGIIKIFDATDGDEILTIKGNEEEIFGIAVSNDGKQIASGDYYGTIKIWDAATGSELMTLSGHKQFVMSVSFSPDGRRLVSSSYDGIVKVWDTTIGVDLMTFFGEPAGRLGTVFSPDGKTIAVFLGSEGIVLWETTEPAGGYGRRKIISSARDVVEQLYEQYGFYYKVVEQLEPDKTLSAPVHRAALQIANSRKWEDAYKLSDESWQVVSSPGGDPNACRVALEKAKKASNLEPIGPSILATLGVAQYRVGAYEDALTTLTKADKIWTDAKDPRPEAIAFMAMTLQKLGRNEEAKAALERLRTLLKDEQFAQDGQAKAFLAEAEKLIAGEKQ
jgi:WD40 repeat protein/tRNA A-37 threonylcarbamoyl transferase component Bud32